MDVMKLPAAQAGPGTRSRRRAGPDPGPGGEQRKRQKNACLVPEEHSVKVLEDLVFGAEHELLGRLAEVGPVPRPGTLMLVPLKIRSDQETIHDFNLCNKTSGSGHGSGSWVGLWVRVGVGYIALGTVP